MHKTVIIRQSSIAFGLTASAFLSTAALAQSPLELGLSGLGNINASTRFELETLQATAPQLNWKHSEQATEDGARDVMVASQNGEIIAKIYGDRRNHIETISVLSRKAENGLGPRIGATYGQLKENLQLGSCRPGLEAQVGMVVCHAAESPIITYTFSGIWSGPDGQLPPRSTLTQWTVSQITWRATGFDNSGQAPVTKVGPSFDCTKAAGRIEALICNDTELADLDLNLHDAYVRILRAANPAEKAKLRTYQRGWIKGRNDCWKSTETRDCVAMAYKDRITELSSTRPLKTLSGTSWRGMRIAGDTIPSFIDVNLTFELNGQITGASGCNRFFASFDQAGEKLRVGPIGSTKRLCPEIEMLAERRFLDALSKISGWSLRGGELILFGNGAELSFSKS